MSMATQIPGHILKEAVSSSILSLSGLYSNFNTRGGNDIMHLSHIKVGVLGHLSVIRRDVFHVEVGFNL